MSLMAYENILTAFIICRKTKFLQQNRPYRYTLGLHILRYFINATLPCSSQFPVHKNVKLYQGVVHTMITFGVPVGVNL
jgi:hypothetical protein